MSNNQGSLICMLGGWGLAFLAGILGAILLLLLGDWRLIQAIFAAIVITIILGALLSWIVCRPLPVQGELPRSAPPNPVPSNAESAKAAAQAAREGAEPEPVSAPAAAARDARAGVKPSTPLAGEAELAERKGTWKYEPAAATGSSAATSATAAAAASADKAAADKAAADKAAADKAAAEKAAADKAAAEKAAADKAAEEKAAAEKAAAAKADAELGEDYDGDGVREGVNEGKRPAALDGPRGGHADNLKEIKGIGPKLELLCHTLGFFHFDQIANWTADEVAWVDANLEGFKGRVTRDKWVEQAKILASGGETEFSKRVDDGDVY